MKRVEPGISVAITIQRGSALTVCDPDDRSMCDLLAYGASDVRDIISNGGPFKSVDYVVTEHD